MKFPYKSRPPLSKEHREKLSLVHTGKKLSEVHKLNLSSALKGKMPKNIRMIAGSNKGVPHTEETKKKLSIASKKNIGDRASNWQGGITPILVKIRHSEEYKVWRKSVFERDKYICILGGKKHGSKLQADHIKPFAYFPELRFAIENGRTLCVECHRKTDTYGGGGRKYKK